ncbi:TDT family transporter [Nonomuraea sp. NPDC050556]|uniref:TDT family transporter n=1 Tax=Nonomuraea sp. NPDC050556 TaxID=3364369 RepID=UPI003799E6CB
MSVNLPFGLLSRLDRPSDLFRHLGPNWYAAVMGTGIVANAAASLPFPWLRAPGTVVWLLASVLLVALTAAWIVHWVRYPAAARAHADHPVMAHFWGAPAMALMTIGLGALTFGKDLVGLNAALWIDWPLWTAGTLLGLVTAVWIPYKAITSHAVDEDAVFGGWLMPVVPPMVSAATGAVLVQHLPAGQARATMLAACMAMFGVSLFATLAILPQLWRRLMHSGTGPALMTPTLWIMLGPLGQSITAAGNLSDQVPGSTPIALLYGLPTWGFALMWLALCVTLTMRAVRRGMPFGLTWWAFIFPVGTVVTATSSLHAHTGMVALGWIATVLYAFLVVMWVKVAARTLRLSLRGDLFLPAPRAADLTIA